MEEDRHNNTLMRQDRAPHGHPFALGCVRVCLQTPVRNPFRAVGRRLRRVEAMFETRSLNPSATGRRRVFRKLAESQWLQAFVQWKGTMLTVGK
jgi:hypothetical protein